MATCETADGRITAWSLEDTFQLPLSNPEDIEARFPYQLDDFEYSDGRATYAPRQSKLVAMEVAELKGRLADTDYIACKIAEGAATAGEYAEQIAQRAAWRERINELENETQPVQESL